MKYKQLGKTGVLVSELCLGTMTFGGSGYWKAVGQLAEDEVTNLLKTALDNGINFFDTANAYSEGLAELLFGKALKSLGISRQTVFIATKVRLRISCSRIPGCRYKRKLSGTGCSANGNV